MKLTIIKGLIACFGVMLLAFSCNKPETELGNSRVYFGNAAPTLDMVDRTVTSLADIAAQPDSVIYFIGVYRSGMTENLDKITVSLKADFDYIDQLITDAQPGNRYEFSKAMPADMFSLPASVTIPSGERSAVVPVTIKMSKVKAYLNSHLNYSIEDFDNPDIKKNKMLVMCLSISAVSKYEILESKSHCLLEIVKCMPNLVE